MKARAAVLAALLAIVPASAAEAATTLGPALSHTFQQQLPCPQRCLFVHETVPGVQTVSPVDGVITSWSVLAEGEVSLTTVRYSGDDTARRVATSPVDYAGDLELPETFPSRLPIAAGDRVGLVLGYQSYVGIEDLAGSDLDIWKTAPGPGETATADFSDVIGQASFSATVEPDADADGYGDETQDGCPTDRRAQGSCANADKVSPRVRASVRAKGSALRLTLRLSERAKVRLTLARRSGRRYRKVASVTGFASAGKGTVRLKGRVGGHRLRRGRYQLTVVATDEGFNRSRPVRVRFRVR